jgi:hypothetical protein
MLAVEVALDSRLRGNDETDDIAFAEFFQQPARSRLR